MNRTVTKSSSGRKKIVDEFDSVGDFVAYVTDPSKKTRAGLECPSVIDGRKDFFWTETFAEAVQLSQVGWPEGTGKVVKHREGMDAFVTAAVSAKTRQHGWDLTGDYIDIGRYMTGEPEVFGCEIDNGESLNGKVVSIRLNASVSGAVKPETICARGVTVLVAVDLLESLGVRCEVYVSSGAEAAWSGAGNDPALEHYDFNVLVKRSSEPVDPDRLAFAVAHPAFFRRLGFRCEELVGYSPNGARPSPLLDHGKRGNTIEIDEILTAAALKPKELKQNVLAIAKKCGVDFNDEQVRDLIASCT